MGMMMIRSKNSFEGYEAGMKSNSNISISINININNSILNRNHPSSFHWGSHQEQKQQHGLRTNRLISTATPRTMPLTTTTTTTTAATTRGRQQQSIVSVRRMMGSSSLDEPLPVPPPSNHDVDDDRNDRNKNDDNNEIGYKSDVTNIQSSSSSSSLMTDATSTTTPSRSFYPEQRNHILSTIDENNDNDTTMSTSVIIDNTLDWLEQVVIGLNLCPFAERPYKLNTVSIQVIYGTNQMDILTSVLSECIHRQTAPGTTLIVCPNLFPTNFISFLEVYNMCVDGVLVDNDLDCDIQIAPFHPNFEFGTDSNKNDENDDDEEEDYEDDDDYDENDNGNREDQDDEEEEEDEDSVLLSSSSSSNDSIDHYTNRSPYPIFHILREEEVSKAVRALDGDASRVWKRNIALLRALQDEFQEKDDDSDDNEEVEQVEVDGRNVPILHALLRGKVHDPSIQQRVRKVLQRIAFITSEGGREERY
jgi:hypothetical protein